MTLGRAPAGGSSGRCPGVRTRVTSLAVVLSVAVAAIAPARAGGGPVAEDAPVTNPEIEPSADADFWSQPPSLDELDTTVTLDELKAVRGWRKAKRVRRGDDVMVTLHVEDGTLRLSVVEDKTGIVEQFRLGRAVLRGPNHTFDGTTVPAHVGADGEPQPLVFAIRARSTLDVADDAYRQVAVWADGRTLKVAERAAGATRWRPRLRLTFDKGTTFRGIGTTYPH